MPLDRKVCILTNQMVKETSDPNASRQRILDAARAEFAEKGFDGARVDEIAKRAQVNKALIYYYFKSKDELLQELLRRFLEERRQRRPDQVTDPGLADLPSQIAQFDLDFLFERRDILRIALMEDLKASRDGVPGAGTVLKHWLEGLASSRADYDKAGYGFRLTPRVLAAMYFFHLMPLLAFSSMGETLAKATGQELSTVRAEFLKLLLELNGHHFHSVFGASRTDPAPEVDLPGSERPAPPAPEPPIGRPPPQDHLKSTPEERAALVAKCMPKGRLENFPLKEKARLAVIEHISSLFRPDTIYTEKQVDTLLKTLVDDHSKARRYLIDYKYLHRRPDGSAYWTWDSRTPENPAQ